MKFSFGGSTANYWNKFAKNFQKGGEAGNIVTGLTKNWQNFKENPVLKDAGNKIWKDLLGGDKLIGSEGKVGVIEHNKNWYMGISRQAAPLWEGGLTHVGGSTKDLLDWGEDVAMKSSHHLFGTQIPGYGADGGSAATGAGTVTNSEAEDPSLINQVAGNWKRPGEIESALRREESMRKGTLYHDLAKTEEGRQKVKSLA